MNKRWYACELHCHTLHSDGDFSVRELIETAKERHLDAIQLTDHNTVSGHSEAEDDTLVILKSIEWTTYFGHMHAMDCGAYVDWRDAREDNIDEKISQVRIGGGLVGVCHPFQLGTPVCTGGRWDFIVRDWSDVNYMEIWSEGCPFMNTPNKRAYFLWHSLLDKGYKITPTFGRDWHRKTNNACHSACTYLLCDGDKLTADEVKSAVKNGRSVISLGVLFFFYDEKGNTIGDTIEKGEHTLSFRIDMSRFEKMKTADKMVPRSIRLISQGGEIIKEVSADTESVKINMKENSRLSAELYGKFNDDENCLLALTAPVYTGG